MKASDTVMNDTQIREAMSEALKQAQDYGDDGVPIPERNVAREQADVSFKAGIKEVVDYLNSKRVGGYNFCVKLDWDEWQSKLKEWGCL